MLRLLGDLWLFHPDIVGADIQQITISLYSLCSPVFALASTLFRLAFTSVALPPGKQCMIARLLFLTLILRVMESPMTRVFNLSELMVGGFGVSDPVTSGGGTREGSASDSLLKWGEPVGSFCPTAFLSRRLRGLCGMIYTTICTYLWHRRGFILSYT
jgi:hypothetical protein